MTQTTKRKIVTVRSQNGTYALRRNKIEQIGGSTRWATREQIREAFYKGLFVLHVKYKGSDYDVAFSGRVVFGRLSIGCQEFSVSATTKIRRWAQRGAK